MDRDIKQLINTVLITKCAQMGVGYNQTKTVIGKSISKENYESVAKCYADTRFKAFYDLMLSNLERDGLFGTENMYTIDNPKYNAKLNNEIEINCIIDALKKFGTSEVVEVYRKDSYGQKKNDIPVTIENNEFVVDDKNIKTIAYYVQNNMWSFSENTGKLGKYLRDGSLDKDMKKNGYQSKFIFCGKCEYTYAHTSLNDRAFDTYKNNPSHWFKPDEESYQSMRGTVVAIRINKEVSECRDNIARLSAQYKQNELDTSMNGIFNSGKSIPVMDSMKEVNDLVKSKYKYLSDEEVSYLSSKIIRDARMSFIYGVGDTNDGVVSDDVVAINTENERKMGFTVKQIKHIFSTYKLDTYIRSDDFLIPIAINNLGKSYLYDVIEKLKSVVTRYKPCLKVETWNDNFASIEVHGDEGMFMAGKLIDDKDLGDWSKSSQYCVPLNFKIDLEKTYEDVITTLFK